MEQEERLSKIEQFERLCREQGLPVTVQRRAVMEALAGRQDHPTADQIFEVVRERVPGISRTTVYRILETFVRIGVARKVSHPGAAARFETEMGRHHHLLCLQCGRMTDLVNGALDSIPISAIQVSGFELTDYSIQFRGTCSACARKVSPKANGKTGTGRRGLLNQSQRRAK